MAFSLRPEESGGEVNRAGQVLVLGASGPTELESARNLAERWRACHAYPINTFQATLRRKLKHYNRDPMAAQRLKRMPTIIDKLRRYPTMQLTEMQDIGGSGPSCIPSQTSISSRMNTGTVDDSTTN